MEREIRKLLDERAITAVMNAYCHAMDTGRAQDWLDCFTADAIFDVRLPNGETYVHLVGEVDLARFAHALRDRPGHKHVYATPIFQVDVEAGEAEVSSYYLMLVGDGTSAGVSSFGRALDRFVKQGDRWRIRERCVTTDGMAPGSA